MGIPIINTPQDFRSYVAGVHMRRDFKPPTAFAIGAVHFDAEGNLIEARFPKLNRGENFGSAAAFADVTHHRFGTAVRPLGFWEFKELEQLFEPFLDDVEHHPNVSAFREVYRLACSPHNMTPVVVFMDEEDQENCRGNLIYEAFMEQLSALSATVH